MTATRRTGERGAALLLVTVAVAVLTALAVDLAYDARLTLRIAANGRDELRAAYAARGGVELARLVLGLQKQIDAQAQMPGMPRPLLWRLVPVDSALASGLFEGGEGRGAPLEFHAAIDDESRKVNMQLEGVGQTDLPVKLRSLYRLICDPRWDALFDREDEKGNRVSRQELLVYLHDWIDTLDQDASALAAQFPVGTCEIVLTRLPDPFERGGGDKNQPYDRGQDRYRTKNARMDSLDELYLVAGIGDAFMAAFGDAITVYLPRSAKRNVNEIDRDRLVDLATLIASAKSQPALLDQDFGEALQKLVSQATFGGLLSNDPKQFANMVAGLGVALDPSATTDGGPLTDRSNVFSIRSEARSGDVTKALEVVVRLDRTATGAAGTAAANPMPGQLALGLPIHWREE